jgi:RimJ/RimL family protein N-acetyltransferase
VENVAPWMSAFTERAVTTGDAAWVRALFSAPHACPFMFVPSLEAVRATIGRAGYMERIVLDDAGSPAALWRASIEESWIAEIRTIVAVTSGRGAGTWALRRALAWAFEERSVHRVFLYVTAANARARALYERHGMLWEGTERDGFLAPNGTYEDLCHYGMLEGEYAARRW